MPASPSPLCGMAVCSGPLALSLSLSFSLSLSLSLSLCLSLSSGYATPQRRTETGSVPSSAVRTVRDQEALIADLRKENFALKLRLYELEETLLRYAPGDAGAVLNENVELRVKTQQLEHELEEKLQLLLKARAALDAYSDNEEARIHDLQSEHQRRLEAQQRSLEEARAEAEQARSQLEGLIETSSRDRAALELRMQSMQRELDMQRNALDSRRTAESSGQDPVARARDLEEKLARAERELRARDTEARTLQNTLEHTQLEVVTLRDETAYARREAAELRRRLDRTEASRAQHQERDAEAAASRERDEALAKVRQLEEDLALRTAEIKRLRTELVQQDDVVTSELAGTRQSARELAAERRQLDAERELHERRAAGEGRRGQGPYDRSRSTLVEDLEQQLDNTRQVAAEAQSRVQALDADVQRLRQALESERRAREEAEQRLNQPVSVATQSDLPPPGAAAAAAATEAARGVSMTAEDMRREIDALRQQHEAVLRNERAYSNEAKARIAQLEGELRQLRTTMAASAATGSAASEGAGNMPSSQRLSQLEAQLHNAQAEHFRSQKLLDQAASKVRNQGAVQEVMEDDARQMRLDIDHLRRQLLAEEECAQRFRATAEEAEAKRALLEAELRGLREKSTETEAGLRALLRDCNSRLATAEDDVRAAERDRDSARAAQAAAEEAAGSHLRDLDGRDRLVTELRAQVSQLNDAVRAAQAEAADREAAVRRYRELESINNTLTRGMKAAQDDTADMAQRLAALSAKHESLVGRQRVEAAEHRDLERVFRDFQRDTALRERELTDSIESLHRRLEEADEHLTTLRANESQLTMQVHALQDDVCARDRRLADAETALDACRNEVMDRDTLLTQRQREIEELKRALLVAETAGAQLATLRTTLAETEAREARIRNELAAVQTELAAAKAALDEGRQRLRDVELTLRGELRGREVAEQGVRDAEARYAELEARTTATVQRIQRQQQDTEAILKARDSEVARLLAELERINRAFRQAVASGDAVRQQLRLAEAEISRQQDFEGELRAARAETDAARAELEVALEELRQRSLDFEKQSRQMEARLLMQDDELLRLRPLPTALEDAESAIRSRELELSRAHDELLRMRRELEDVAGAAHAVRQQADRERRSAEQLQHQLQAEIDNSQARLQAAEAEAENRVQRMAQRLPEMERRLRDTELELAAKADALKVAETRLRELELALAATEGDVDLLTRELDEQRRATDAEQGRVAKLQSTVEETTQRLRAAQAAEDRLAGEVSRLEAHIRDVQRDQGEDRQALTSLSSERDRLAQALREAESKEAALSSRLAAVEAEAANRDTRVQRLTAERDRLDAELRDAQSRLSSLQTEADDAKATYTQRIRALDDELRKLSNDRRAAEDALSSTKTGLQGLEDAEKLLRSRLAQVEAERDDFRRRLAREDDVLRRAQDDVNVRDRRIRGLEEEIATLRRQRNEDADDLAALTRVLGDLRGEHRRPAASGAPRTTVATEVLPARRQPMSVTVTSVTRWNCVKK